MRAGLGVRSGEGTRRLGELGCPHSHLKETRGVPTVPSVYLTLARPSKNRVGPLTHLVL